MKSSICLLVVLVLVVAAFEFAKADLAHLLWQDDFSTCRTSNGCTPNTAIWSPSVGTPSNNEAQTWEAANCKVNTEGQLVLTAIYSGGKWTSCQTQTKVSWAIAALSYTIIEFSAIITLPHFTGAWPAFWLLGANGQGWPLNGEIDIMEIYNYRSGQQSGKANSQTLYGGIHYLCGGEKAASSCPGRQYWNCACSGGGGTKVCGSSSSPCYWPDGVHTYSVKINKSAKTIQWLLDGSAYHTLDASGADFDTFFDPHDPLYIILDLAIGGNGAGNVVQTSPSTQQMKVQSIHVSAQ